MTATIDYYFATVSPWSYLGHDRVVALAKAQGARLVPKPINLGEVFPVSGGLPLAKRAPQRQAYRLVELARWADHLGKPMHIEPRHFPANGTLAATWVLAAAETSEADALALTGAIHRALWEDERDVADAATLADCARASRLDAEALAARAPAMADRYAALTQEAIARGVFGAPTYFLDGEMYWGQDRLDFLARKLAK
jgi:2-hydroxychromene-2-carboxylate isomerase